MKHADFVHLHLHSQYSLLDGAIKIPDLVKRAHDLHMPAVAVTDHGNMFGAVEFYREASKQGVKPIIGCEIYVAPGSRLEKSGVRGSSEASNHLLCLAMNQTGYRNLCHLVSQAYQDGFYYRPRVDWDLLEEYNEGIIVMSACLGGEIPQLILNNRLDDARRRSEEIAQIFDNDRFYLELQENFIPEQKIANDGLINIAKETGLPLVATNDCHYLTRENAYAHEVLLCIQTGKTMDDTARMRFHNDEFYMKTPDEMAALFSHVPEALQSTVDIASRCNLDF